MADQPETTSSCVCDDLDHTCRALYGTPRVTDYHREEARRLNRQVAAAAEALGALESVISQLEGTRADGLTLTPKEGVPRLHAIAAHLRDELGLGS